MLLELKNIESSYGNIKALKGVNLSVPEGKSSHSSVPTAPASPRP